MEKIPAILDPRVFLFVFVLFRVLLKLLFSGDCCESYAVLSAMSVAHSALLTYNAALNRPAYQSSELTENAGTYVASLANDGSRETNATKGNKARCSVSEIETNPWWAVDLGRPTRVYRVDLTNIGDPYGM